MPRGRKKATPDTAGNVTRATLLSFNDELTEALRLKASADGVVSNVYKRAEQAGLDRKTLKKAHADALKASNERQVDHERYCLYMLWLNAPVGTQAELEIEPTDKSGEGDPEEAEAVAKHEINVAFTQGVNAGRAGASVASAPYDPGTEQHQSWSTGWAEGQREAVTVLGGATRRHSMAAQGDAA